MDAQSTVEQPTWLARTKLRPPTPRADTIPRRRLLDALAEGVQTRPLTLVAAPAGFGKTTLLAALPAALPDLPLAWLTVDADDDDPARFLAALIAAVRQRNPACGGATAALLAGLPDPGQQARHVIDRWINELLAEQPEPFALVLDDLHTVADPAIFAALDRLLERGPPQLHLVIGSRHEPPLALARLRARRELAELRPAALRFTPEETDRLLRDALGLDLSPARVAALHARAGGWAAATILLAGAQALAPDADAADPPPFPAGGEEDLFDYLADEVLRAQPPPTRDFLLRTAILPELTPALCQAVTGRADAATLLHDLYRENLFLTATGEGFRYHDLFRDLLREQLSRAGGTLARESHRRAAAAEREPRRAVNHWLAAEAWDEAATAIEVLGETLVDEGAFAALHGWLAALPPAIGEDRPRLLALRGLVAHERAELDRARTLLERATVGLAAAEDGALRALALLALATCRSTLADFAGAAAATDEALGLPVAPHRRIHLLIGRAWQTLAAGDVAATNAALDDALALANATGAARGLPPLATQFHSPFVVLPGGVARAERCATLLRAAAGDQASPLGAAAASLGGLAALHRGRWTVASASFERALAVGDEYGGLPWVTVEAAPHLAACLALRGDQHAAAARFDALFQALADPAAQAFAAPWLAVYRCWQARIAWLGGDHAGVRTCAAQLAATAAHDWPVAVVARALLGALVALAEGQTADAERQLRAVAARQRQTPGATISGDAAILLAHLLRQADRPREALTLLGPVLAASEREGTPGRLLLEGGAIIAPLLRLAIGAGHSPIFAARTLTLLDENRLVTTTTPAQGSPVATGEALSPREIEVLHLLAAGASNAAIAAALFLSIHTVKRHVANVLRKLEVESRAAAVTRASERGLL